MELVKGENLADFLLEGKVLPGEFLPRIPEELCKTIIRQILGAIHYIHGQGIVHRDMKLDNILLQGVNTDDIRVKLIDFGTAKKIK